MCESMDPYMTLMHAGIRAQLQELAVAFYLLRDPLLLVIAYTSLTEMLVSAWLWLPPSSRSAGMHYPISSFRRALEI